MPSAYRLIVRAYRLLPSAVCVPAAHRTEKLEKPDKTVCQPRLSGNSLTQTVHTYRASCRRVAACAAGRCRGAADESFRRRAGADHHEVAAVRRRKSAARCRRRHMAAVARRSAGAAAGCRGDVGCGREAAVVYLRVRVVRLVDVHGEVD